MASEGGSDRQATAARPRRRVEMSGVPLPDPTDGDDGDTEQHERAQDAPDVHERRHVPGSVRVEAPGFTGQSANPYQNMMMAGAASSFPVATGAQDPAAPPATPEMEGTFRIVTDGRILANNTDEGPLPGQGGQVLEWKVSRRTQAAPMALILLGS